MNLIEKLISLRHYRITKEVLAIYGIEFPAEVKVGLGLRIIHRGFGLVVHPKTVFGDNVTLYHGVTIGRADAHVPGHKSMMKAILIDDGAILFPGCVVLGGPGVTRVGKNSIIAANAVLTKSTGDNEIWGGVPAVKISDRYCGNSSI